MRTALRNIALLDARAASPDAINCLPPSLRDIARERYIVGLNSAQIGQIHSLTPSAVRARLRAAASIIKSELL